MIGKETWWFPRVSVEGVMSGVRRCIEKKPMQFWTYDPPTIITTCKCTSLRMGYGTTTSAHKTPHVPFLSFGRVFGLWGVAMQAYDLFVVGL